MNTVLMSFLSMSFPGVSIESGSYRLEELCKLLSTPSQAIRASEECADDVYVVNIETSPLEEVMNALTATGRVVISRDEKVWIINPNPVSVRNRLDMANVARNAQIALVDSTYGEQLRLIEQVRASDSKRAELLDQLRANAASDPTKSRLAHEMYLYFGNERPFPSIGFPVKMSAVFASQLPLKVTYLKAKDHPDAFALDGKWEESRYYSIFRRSDPDLIRDTLAFGGKFTFDPFTNNLFFRLTMNIRVNKAWINGTLAGPEHVGTVSPDWRGLPRLVQGIDDRIERTADVLKAERAKQSVSGGEGSLRVREALTKWASETGQSLIAYVGPASDLRLAQTTKFSLKTILETANKGQFESQYLVARLEERNLSGAPNAGVCLLSADKADEIWIVRDEFDYRDQFVERVPAAATQPKMTGSLKPVFNLVQSLPISSWLSPNYPEAFVGVTNPVALFPFAKLLAVDTAMMQRIVELKPGREVTIRLSATNSVALTAFQNGLRSIADLHDVLAGSGQDPVQLPSVLTENALAIQFIKVARANNRLDLQYSVSDSVKLKASVHGLSQ